MKFMRFLSRIVQKLRKRPDGPEVLASRDFSAVEDSAEAYEIIRQLAANAGKSADSEARARGLSRTFVRGQQIIKVLPEGKETVLSAGLPTGQSFYVNYPPSTVLHARKK